MSPKGPSVNEKGWFHICYRFEVFGINGRVGGPSPQPAFTSNVWCVRRRGGEGVVRGVVARRVVGRRRSVHGRIRTPSLRDFTTAIVTSIKQQNKNRASGGYCHSDFKRNHGPGAPAEPSACLFHNPHAKESASTSLDHPCTSR